MHHNMKKLIHYLALISLLSSTVSTACAWSDEEQEIIDYVAKAWDAWMEAVEKNDPEIFAAEFWEDVPYPGGDEYVFRTIISLLEND